MITERDWLRAARELPEDELLCCPYINCTHVEQGLDAMRTHICSAHLFYFPFKCQLCEKKLPFCTPAQFEQQHNCVQRDSTTFHQCQPMELYDEAKEAQLHTETGEVVKARMLKKEAMKRAAEEEEAVKRAAKEKEAVKRAAEEKKAAKTVASSKPRSETGADSNKSETKLGKSEVNLDKSETNLCKSEHPPTSPSSKRSNGAVTGTMELTTKGGFGARNYFRRAMQASVTEIQPAKSEHPTPSPSSSSRATVEVIKTSFGMRVKFRRSGGGPAV